MRIGPSLHPPQPKKIQGESSKNTRPNSLPQRLKDAKHKHLSWIDYPHPSQPWKKMEGGNPNKKQLHPGEVELPAKITNLEFGFDFNQPLEMVKLPKSLQHLAFGSLAGERWRSCSGFLLS